MKVGLVCPYSFDEPGGVQAQVLGLAGWLTRQGHHARVIGPGRPDPDVLSRFGLAPDLVVSTGGAVPLPYNQSVARVAMGPMTARAVRAWLAAGDFDVLHLHEPTTPSASWLALVGARTPVLATFHTARPRALSLQLASRLAHRTLDRVDAATSVSWVAHDAALRDAGIESEVVPNGVRLPAGELGPQPPAGRWRGGEHPRVVFVGRYAERRKGLSVLLRAVPLVRSEHPDLEVVVVGEGPRLDVPGITCTGRLPDDARDRLLASTDVYVAPNLGRESFGVVLLEAMAAGAPVVASDLTAFRDVVTDEKGAVARLFPVDDHRGLARDVLASLSERRPDLELRGRRIAERHDWDHVGPRVLQQYERARSQHVLR